MLSRLFSATASALLLLAALPAQARDPYANQSPQAWGAALASAGIGLKTFSSCDPGHLASYHSSDRSIWLCPAALRGDAPSLYETVAHEAVHAMQHCAGRKEGSSYMMPLSLFLHRNGEATTALQFLNRVHTETTSRMTLVRRSIGLGSSASTPLIHETLEREAYALEDEPNLVLELLPLFCSR